MTLRFLMESHILFNKTTITKRLPCTHTCLVQSSSPEISMEHVRAMGAYLWTRDDYFVFQPSTSQWILQDVGHLFQSLQASLLLQGRCHSVLSSMRRDIVHASIQCRWPFKMCVCVGGEAGVELLALMYTQTPSIPHLLSMPTVYVWENGATIDFSSYKCKIQN